jgi:hypothetical protein
MKTRAILLLLGLLISSSSAFSQEPKDSLQKYSFYPSADYFSPDESWNIHKEAYRKQLKADGLSEAEINEKMKENEKKKDEFVQNILKQRELARKQMRLAEIQRQQAEEQRKLAAVEREEMEKQMKLARDQSQLAEKQRKLSEGNRQDIESQRKLVEDQRQLADEQKKLAAAHRQEAEKQRELADKQMKLADNQRKVAEEQRKNGEEWRNNLKNLLNESFTISDKDSKSISAKIRVTEKSALFFNVNSEINSGNVLIEIFNPSGKKEGELSLEHSNAQKGQINQTANTTGSLNKTINSPETGDWSVKITPERSAGNVNISVAQHIKNSDE